MTDVAAVETRLTTATRIVDRLDHLAVPTVAVIHGYCLGGGSRSRWPATTASRSRTRGSVFPR
jgi:enoyl-CoA hydratase/carnithine racemase